MVRCNICGSQTVNGRCGCVYPQPIINNSPNLTCRPTKEGWECPKCKSVYAPWYPKCDKYGDK